MGWPRCLFSFGIRMFQLARRWLQCTLVKSRLVFCRLSPRPFIFGLWSCFQFTCAQLVFLSPTTLALVSLAVWVPYSPTWVASSSHHVGPFLPLLYTPYVAGSYR